MPFNSVAYLMLLAVTVAVFWSVPVRWRRGLVFAAGVAFYATWGWVFIWVPLLIAFIVWAAGKQIAGAESEKKRWWLRVGVTTTVLLLVLFKYRDFLLVNAKPFTDTFHVQPISLATAIAFPMGISFYTLEAIAYLMDLRQGRVKMPRFVDLCVYFYFWPNILSGPIVRARELMPQLSFEKSFEPRFVFEGLDRIIWGLVQKNVVANLLGVWVDRGFATGNSARPATLDGWFLAAAFGLQLYFDFGGYTNIAIGAARLLGVTLPGNFRQPYHAATPADFWTRWHLTLSRFVRDYLFFPINAKWAGAAVPLYVSLIGVMTLVGLWHGAGWGFLLWGTLHGLYLVVYRMYESWKNKGVLSAASGASAGIGWRVMTLLAVTAAWVPFRATTLAKAGSIWSAMFWRFSIGRGFGAGFYLYTLAVAAFCVVEPWLMRKLSEADESAATEGISPMRVIVRPLAYAAGLLLFLVFEENNLQFIYSQF